MRSTNGSPSQSQAWPWCVMWGEQEEQERNKQQETTDLIEPPGPKEDQKRNTIRQSHFRTKY